MKKVFLFCALICILTSCKNNNLQKKNKSIDIDQLLSGLNSNDTIQLLDLSNMNIKILPDLSKYKIRKLDISHNQLDTLVMKNLPEYLTILDASHNQIKKGVNFINTKKGYSILANNISKHIKEVNLSYNRIEGISFFLYDESLKKIDLSFNNIKTITISEYRIHYLNISNNKKFSNIVSFDPKKIDTIIRNNIANNLPLKLIDLPRRKGIKD